MVNSKNKGSCFEREVRQLLTKASGFEWFRVPMSGAYSTSTNTSSHVFKGDVYTDEPFFKDLVIECKSYKDLKFNSFFNNKSVFWDWIRQCESESQGHEWLLFFKINRLGTYVVRDINHQGVVNKVYNYEYLTKGYEKIRVYSEEKTYEIKRIIND